MSGQSTAGEQILEMVRTHPDCTLDELIHYLHDWSWSEIFVEVDRLSRSGRLRLTQSGTRFLTTLRVE